MIVVIGAVGARGSAPDLAPGGLAAAIALGAGSAGARVEIVARIGDDPAGDAILLAFAAAGVGHVATLRDPARPTPVMANDDETTDPDPVADAAEPGDGPATLAPILDAADVSLALRYLADYRVIVAVHPAGSGILAEVTSAAAYASAHLVIVTDPDAASVDEAPLGALVVAAAPDATGVAELLGRYAASVDGGEDPAAAFGVLSGAAGLAES